MYGKTYACGLWPQYWYRPEDPYDLVRHRMKGYGNILWMTFPFAYDRSGANATVSLDFQPASGPLDGLSIEIGNPSLGPDGKLHIREIRLR